MDATPDLMQNPAMPNPIMQNPAPPTFVAGDTLGPFRMKRLAVVLGFVALAIWPGEVGALTRTLMTDAYVQVSAFVAATLFLFYGVEKLFHFNIGTALSNARGWQVPIAALMGATPGCGGAVVVVAAYTSGHVGLGAIVAALTATMGDAAFLLIATRPDAALIVLPLSLIVGVLMGWLVDRFNRIELGADTRQSCEIAPLIGRLRARDWLYIVIVAPGLVIGISQMVMLDLAASYAEAVRVVGLAGTAVGLWVWATSPLQAMTHPDDATLTRVAEETSFISVWVIGAYLAYDYVVTFAGVDLAATFSTMAPLLPLIAIVIGFVPGCGPQILVATLYINGVIPFAALIGNAISNDGDALFPAIALDPKAAVVATLYSTVPALIVAYGFHLFAPGFLN